MKFAQNARAVVPLLSILAVSPFQKAHAQQTAIAAPTPCVASVTLPESFTFTYSQGTLSFWKYDTVKVGNRIGISSTGYKDSEFGRYIEASSCPILCVAQKIASEDKLALTLLAIVVDETSAYAAKYDIFQQGERIRVSHSSIKKTDICNLQLDSLSHNGFYFSDMQRLKHMNARLQQKTVPKSGKVQQHKKKN